MARASGRQKVLLKGLMGAVIGVFGADDGSVVSDSGGCKVEDVTEGPFLHLGERWARPGELARPAHHLQVGAVGSQVELIPQLRLLACTMFSRTSISRSTSGFWISTRRTLYYLSSIFRATISG